MTEDELLAQALGRALEVIQQRVAGASAPAITVAQLYDRYKTANKQRKSWSVIEDRLKAVVKYFAERDAMSLRLVDWSDYRSDREAMEIPSGKPGRRYGAHTINLELSWFKGLLNFGVLQGRISHNPIATAKPVKTRSKRSTAPTEHDVSALLGQCDDRMRVIVLCAADAGMRRNEATQLRWDWIDRDARVIRLPEWICKSGHGRTVQLTGRMLEAIDALPRHFRSAFVISRPDGAPYHKNNVSRWFRTLADASGVEASPADRRVVLHDVRRGFATNACRRGVKIEVVSGLLGHHSLDQTRDYVEVVDADVTSARETFEAGIERDKKR